MKASSMKAETRANAVDRYRTIATGWKERRLRPATLDAAALFVCKAVPFKNDVCMLCIG